MLMYFTNADVMRVLRLFSVSNVRITYNNVSTTDHPTITVDCIIIIA